MKTYLSLTQLTPDATLSQIVSIDRQAGQLLASIGLEPSNHKDETLRSVCQQRQWSEVEVLQWIKNNRPSMHENSGNDNARQMSDFGDDVLKWADYIEQELLMSNIQLLNEISDNFPRVQQVHGNQYSQLKNMKWHFETYEDALRLYFAFEKKKFFNLIRKLQTQKGDILDGTMRGLERCMHIIEEDQEHLKRYIGTIREKGNYFENPRGACTSLRILNQNFKMLYSSLNRQFNIEKKMLLPLVQHKLDAS